MFARSNTKHFMAHSFVGYNYGGRHMMRRNGSMEGGTTMWQRGRG